MAAQVWSGVAVNVQSAIASSVPIQSIAVGATATVAASGSNYTTGDYVLITCTSGMRQVSGRIFRVASGATDSFVLEGEVTTGYDAFVSGGAQKLTLGTSLTNITSLTSSGGEPEEIDQTTISDRVRVIVYGASTPSKFAMTMRWDPSDAGFIAIKHASGTNASLAFMIVFPSGYRHLFYGMCFASGDPTGNAQGLVTTPAGITRTGASTFYAT